tara:strand:+ start:22 stop:288 length:267 start_codon:yes stop_codon:yes gene_type:complete
LKYFDPIFAIKKTFYLCLVGSKVTLDMLRIGSHRSAFKAFGGYIPPNIVRIPEKKVKSDYKKTKEIRERIDVKAIEKSALIPSPIPRN